MSKNKYTGTYLGKIVSVDDPKKQCRVRVVVYDVFDDVAVNDLPWAMLSLPLGARAGEGSMCPVRVGDEVTVQFFSGDTRRPIVTGAAHATPSGKPTLPADLWQGDGKMVHKRTDDEPSVPDPGYYEYFVIKQNGALIQFTKAGSIRATQIDTGSAIEILPDGNIVLHCENEILGSATKRILMKTGSSSIEMKPASIKMENGSSSIEITSSSITLKSAKIDLNP